ncbi:hypothetical protein PFISCL1PPCAC_14441, partial [Pristionchus fissidentatus]
LAPFCISLSSMSTSNSLVLYARFASSASWRVRCALNFKGLAYETVPVDIRNVDGQNRDKLNKLNPASRVPVLIHGERVLTESLAIIEYLEETFPMGPRLLPLDAYERAKSRAIALHIACGIQPVQNVRVTRKIDEIVSKGAHKEWAAYWMHLGLQELEGMLRKTAGTYSVGDTVSIADTCIPSIVYKGRGWNVDVCEFPTLHRIDENLAAISAMAAAHQDNQADAPRK